ncbi:hypothetical protein [Massilia sp. BJB1822]|uniref:hypothetical protein n=1 Tax=Massilia sp. BJB1822 TaxID=2744470 RepID=UPI00159498AF|nr:hypothetical protein [Massilia sp. BJB1822]NVE00386.1 hypothetical protein [Massilia sp. BJB1822]
MLRQVNAEGRIELGEEYAGQIFTLVTHPDRRLELLPADVPESSQASWLLSNQEALDAYSRRIAAEGTAAEQLQRYLAEHPEALEERDGKV